ncbi:acyltransferase [bacterium]|nr:acyltransferase [bacterium]
MENKKNLFLNYINIFRGFAILLIIAGHTMQFGENSSLIHKINCEIICGGTTLFIFISGFLFQHLSNKFEYKNYLKKKWTNVVLPYFITSIIGILLCIICPKTYGNSFDGLNLFIQIPMFLTTGRIHNTPTWFIPMIILFFLCSWILLKLEQKGRLYKLLPFMFLITLTCPRIDVDYNSMINLSYTLKYLTCIGYVFNGFIHFFSLYVFGMFCSKYKEVIHVFYNKKLILWSLMIGISGLDIYLNYNNIYSNFTISKTILTMLILGYLKHYDEWITKNKLLNQTLDIFAKYSFGLFFVHWYWFFVYNQIFGLEKVIPIVNNNYICVFGIILTRFLVVVAFSVLSLFISNKIILLINKNINTRMFLGI